MIQFFLQFLRIKKKCLLSDLEDLVFAYSLINQFCFRRCVTEESLKQYNLNKTWHVLSTSVDLSGKEFVSSAETYQYPIVGVQFHPEKSAFEWNSTQNIPHSYKALISSRYFLDWLVNEARKNNNSFSDPQKEAASLIYNYNITYQASFYEQIYLFK